MAQEERNEKNDDLIELEKMMEDEMLEWNEPRKEEQLTIDWASVPMILECQVFQFLMPILNKKEAHVSNKTKLKKADEEMKEARNEKKEQNTGETGLKQGVKRKNE